MKPWVGVAAFSWVLGAVAGCTGASEADAGRDAHGDTPAVDAPVMFDASADTSSDAARADAGADASEPDVGPDANWACSIVPQTGCAPSMACRLTQVEGMVPWVGPPACQAAGTRIEHENYPTPCFEGGLDLCRAGLFCSPTTVCYRYCRPADGCPDSPRGSPQRCDVETYPALFERWGLGRCAF